MVVSQVELAAAGIWRRVAKKCILMLVLVYLINSFGPENKVWEPSLKEKIARCQVGRRFIQLSCYYYSKQKRQKGIGGFSGVF